MKKRAAFACLAFLTASLRLSAVIVAGIDDLTSHEADPGGGVPWLNVGSVNGASGVYLGAFGGGFWALTAAHVGAGDLTLGATTYTMVSGSAVRVTNPNSSFADLTLYRVASDPGLASITISSAQPVAGTSVVMAGFGRNQSGPTAWFVDTTPATWTWNTSFFSGADAIASGYAWTAGNTKRWGTNTIDGATGGDYGYGFTSLLVTDFDLASGEAQGSVGDSGGAIFTFNGSGWELSGMMTAIDQLNGQPLQSAVFGNRTYGADLSAYRSMIVSTIPEPGATAAFIGGASIALVFVRRRRARR